MEQDFYQIDNITIGEAAIRAIVRAGETYNPSILVYCAQIAGLDLEEIPGEDKYNFSYVEDKNIPMYLVAQQNIWKHYVSTNIREPFKNHFIKLIENSTDEVINQWGVHYYNMMRNLDLEYD
jgi:hypothetical protein